MLDQVTDTSFEIVTVIFKERSVYSCTGSFFELGIVDSFGDGYHRLIAAVRTEIVLIHQLVFGAALNIYIGRIFDLHAGCIESAEIDGEIFIFSPYANRLPMSAIHGINTRRCNGKGQRVLVVVVDVGFGVNFFCVPSY